MTHAHSDFPDGVAVVFGGSGGVGSAICTELARAGADIALSYHQNLAAAERTADDVRDLGQRASIHPISLANPDSIGTFLAQVSSQYDTIHTVVCAAGPNLLQPRIIDVTAKQLNDTVIADIQGTFHIVQSALPHLRRSRGSLVCLSSAGVHRYPPGDILSVAPKAAIEALVRGVAREEGRHGVRANAVALGVIDAGQFHRLQGATFSKQWEDAAKKNTALKRFGTATEVAETVVFLASTRSSYLTGQTLMVDGGYSL